MKTTDIFIRTYDKDAPWLRYCLRSIRKFCSGFGSVIVVCPDSSRTAIKPLAEEFGAEFHGCPALHVNDYVGQQLTKMTADTWCRSEIICFMDSDTVFVRPFTPEDIAPSDRIRMLKTPYTETKTPWQPVVQDIVGFDVEFEYMRRHPMSYPREFLAFVRQHIEMTQGKTFSQWGADIEGTSLSEFNVFGAIADHLQPDLIEWLDTTQVPLPELFVQQFWSHGGLKQEIKNEMEQLLS